MSDLQTKIEFLKSVGPQRADLLKTELGVFTFADLLMHFPFRYVDKTRFHKIRDSREEGANVQFKGTIRRMEPAGEGRKMRLVVKFKDDTGFIDLVFFRGISWVQKKLIVGVEYIVYGKLSKFGSNFNIVHPEIEPVSEANLEEALSLEPVYSSTGKMDGKGMGTKGILKLQKILHKQLKNMEMPETLPDYLMEKMRIPNRKTAMLDIHFPKDNETLKLARNRLKFEELFFLQLRLLQIRSRRKHQLKGHVFEKVGEHFTRFYNEKLEFELTGAQKRVIKEIRNDMGRGIHMNRLLQGDVGSGKTVVGLLSMLLALDNGFQACMMAPTEILAQQHYSSMTESLSGLGIQVAFLSGSVKGKKRKKLLELLKEGTIDILIGTHALIEDWVEFKNIGLAIIDEQHRFGVAQRAQLWKKGNISPPHVLVMTATPIPRTLAMTLYGDLDISVIDEMPPGRKEIKTLHKNETNRMRVFGFMREQIKAGRQIYVVYPLIEESDYEPLEDLNNLMEGHEAISKDFPPPEYQISILHGRMKPADKDFEMQRFMKGETQIMVATTVIEVGVNVPNASVMVIENTERFGLSQLHQLRGRVGRGAEQSYCILMSSFKLSHDARTRIQTMCRTNNGFEIAEVDMQLRGAGNIEGTQQSGVISLRMADLAKDGRILQTAREIAARILDDDPKLEKSIHARLKAYLESEKKGKSGWSRIS